MKREKNGITLIALIITIIVLLILAGISINLILEDNGVLSQAANATIATDISQTKEEIKLELVGYYNEDGKYTIGNLKSAVKDVLGSEATIDKSTDGTDTIYTVTTEKNNIVDITDLVNGATLSWYYLNDTQVTNGLETLTSGDTINYNAVADASETKYISYSTENGHSDQTFELTDDSDYKWQIMGADESTGELLIVLSYNSNTNDNFIKSNNNEYYYLCNQAGYANCIKELDNICSLFGQGEGATGARSIIIEDIDKLTGYDPETIVYESGTVYEYGNTVTYTKNYSTGYIDCIGTKYPASLISGTSYKKFTYYTGTEWKTLSSGESAILVSNFYSYVKSDYPENSDIVFTSAGDYWVATPYVRCGLESVIWGCRVVNTDDTGGHQIINSMGYVTELCYGVRPVVSLSPDVSLSENTEGVWEIEI